MAELGKNEVSKAVSKPQARGDTGLGEQGFFLNDLVSVVVLFWLLCNFLTYLFQTKLFDYKILWLAKGKCGGDLFQGEKDGLLDT